MKTYAKTPNKKGVSPIISWVLLLGLAIALGGLVTNWYLQKSKEVTETTLSSLEGGIECNEVNINVAYTKDGSTCVIKVANTGKFKVDKVQINQLQRDYGKNPKEYENYTSSDPEINTICATGDPITVLPMLERDNKLSICQNDRQYTQKPI